MSLGLFLAEIGVPAFLRKREFLLLVALTADAFEAPRPDLRGRPFGEMLEAFATWTSAQAERIVSNPASDAAARERLRAAAVAFGRRLGRRLGVRTRRDVMRAGRILYKILRISFDGAENGEIVIRRCFFSRYYSREACALISGLDEGILAGLAGGGRLEFSARITENESACRARFVFPENPA